MIMISVLIARQSSFDSDAAVLAKAAKIVRREMMDHLAKTA